MIKVIKMDELKRDTTFDVDFILIILDKDIYFDIGDVYVIEGLDGLYVLDNQFSGECDYSKLISTWYIFDGFSDKDYFKYEIDKVYPSTSRFYILAFNKLKLNDECVNYLKSKCLCKEVNL